MRKNKAIRIILYILAAFVLTIAGLFLYYKVVTKVNEPKILDVEKVSFERTLSGSNMNSCEHGWLRKEREGWWVMYLEGSPYEVGFAHGLLAQDLMAGQEKAFLERLAELIPSKFYQRFMLGFVRFFNRNLDQNVKEEYREEIFGISRFASPEFTFMGPTYARMLNYHAAHDLGHAVQNMNLVACTAIGAWNGRTPDSSLIIGRNFDFYINDDFAKDKILCFIKPDSGYRFAMITWAGFAGVVSGMNEKGLVITLNAAKSSIPAGAKTPVSLLAREILQYASNIDEAYCIAQSRQTFVAEAFLVASAADHKAVVIEKTPDDIAIYDPDTNFIILTNHFQSDKFFNDPLNVENMNNETSVYRHDRVKELMDKNPIITPEVVASILRDYRGLGGNDIGLGNEKAVNQFIAHHSVIFEPDKLKIWLAGPPWQLGEYRMYSLDSLRNFAYTLRNSATFAIDFTTKEYRGDATVIPADTLLNTVTYRHLLEYRALSARIEAGIYAEGDADSLVSNNPEFFHTYRVLGDYFEAKGEGQRAERYYRKALEKEAPSAAERRAVGQ